MNLPARAVLSLSTTPRADALARILLLTLPFGAEITDVQASRPRRTDGWSIRVEISARDDQQLGVVSRRIARLVDVVSVTNMTALEQVAQ